MVRSDFTCSIHSLGSTMKGNLVDKQTQNGRGLPALGPILKYRWISIVLCLVAALAIAGVYATTVTRTYTASSTVLLNPLQASPLTPEAANGSGAQLNVVLQTEAQVVSSPAIAEVASEELGRVVPAGGESVEAQVPVGTQMVKISFTSGSPASAAEGAQAFADGFLAYREGRATASQVTTSGALETQAETTEKALQEALAEAEDDGVNSFASRQADLYSDRLLLLSNNIGSTASLGTDPGRVVNPAIAPDSSNQLTALPLLLAGGLLGLIAGLLLAWYREWRSDVVRPDATLSIGGIPVLAGIPASGSDGDSANNPAWREANRRMRAGILASAPCPNTIAVASMLDSGEGPTVALRVATGLAEANHSVVLVCADPSDTAIEDQLEIPRNVVGLSDVLKAGGSGDLDAVILVHENLAVVPSGRAAQESPELLADRGFKSVLGDLLARYDYVVVSSAGANTPNGLSTISVVDSMVLVVVEGRTTRGQVAETAMTFAQLGVNALGVVRVSGHRTNERVATK